MKRIPLFIAMMTLLLTLNRVANFAADDAEGGAAIPRFEQVAPGLYRGGQPSPAGFAFLKWRGIRTVINLREELDERASAEGMGFKYIHIPLDVGDPVSEEALKTFFAIVNDPACQPVFVHCRRGSDRTGVMIGFYRIAVQGWDAVRTYQEARAMGMRWWYRGLNGQLYDFADRMRLANGALAVK